jgi:hypothetical protein
MIINENESGNFMCPFSGDSDSGCAGSRCMAWRWGLERCHKCDGWRTKEGGTGAYRNDCHHEWAKEGYCGLVPHGD